MEPLVTVVVPVYNAERSIERCLCSIRNQTYRNLEVLVVDDGSTDHTEKILEKFERTDPRFRVIWKENSGVSDSRNIAIEEAEGEYLQFVDSDDWIRSDATECMLHAAMDNDCEMVISDFNRVVGHTVVTKGDIPVGGPITREEYAQYMMKAPADFYYGVLWNKFFRTDIVMKQEIKCPAELDWCEDFQMNLEYLRFTSHIYVLQKPIYYYVKTRGSLVSTRNVIENTAHTKKVIFDYYKDLYQSLDLYEQNKVRIQSFYIEFARDHRRRENDADSEE